MIFLTLLVLAVMEVSLSFDNAIVNAKVLTHMSTVWRRRFMVWGLPLAVLGMRLVFPVVIVAAAGRASLPEVSRMIFHDPDGYAQLVAQAHVGIASFGGLFLLLVFLGFLDEEGREHRWITPIEGWWAGMGKENRVAWRVCLPLVAVLALQYALPWPDKLPALGGALLGILVNVGLGALLELCGDGEDPGACAIRQRGILRFIYLEVLDASFSLDGVVAAFAVTHDVLLIALGLGIGAAVIRGLTLKVVRDGLLQEYVYLEHGAHWSIGSLAFLMLLGTVVPVPEMLTGGIGAAIVLLAVFASIRYNLTHD